LKLTKEISGYKVWYNKMLFSLNNSILHILIAKGDEDKAIEVIKRMRGFKLDILNALGQVIKLA
jgi:hypothetical protein